MTDNYKEFVKSYDCIENALDQRNVRRWNGRDFRKPENLSEHTHLVVVCAIEIYDELCTIAPKLMRSTSFDKVVRCALIHDSLEVLRGDILSITKDDIDGLREQIDREETIFYETVLGYKIDAVTNDVVKMADLMACYKYVEQELKWPTNNYVHTAYKQSKERFEQFRKHFYKKNGIAYNENNSHINNRFVKGYFDDAGVDIVLDKDVVLLPLSTQAVDLNVNVKPDEGTMSYLCARTSAANKGLIVAQCPIDPNFAGTVTAIVHNISNDVVIYKKGDSFCQVVTVDFGSSNLNTPPVVKRAGKRSYGKLGSTDT